MHLSWALLTSHGVSQGVSHAKKFHMVFTCISHSFHRVAPSSDSFATTCITDDKINSSRIDSLPSGKQVIVYVFY